MISWSATGRSFVVHDPERLAKEKLGTIFKHSNFASFVRQLNTYSFSKIDPQRWEFSNPFFVKGRRDLLAHIKRKKSTPRDAAAAAGSGPGPSAGGSNPSAPPTRPASASKPQLVPSAGAGAAPSPFPAPPQLFQPHPLPHPPASSPGALVRIPGSAFLRVHRPPASDDPAALLPNASDNSSSQEGRSSGTQLHGQTGPPSAENHSAPPAPHEPPVALRAPAPPTLQALPPMTGDRAAGPGPLPAADVAHPPGYTLGAGGLVDPGLFRPQALPLSLLAAIEADRETAEEKHRKLAADMEVRLQQHFDSRLESMAKVFEDRLIAERTAFHAERELMKRQLALHAMGGARPTESQLAREGGAAPDLVSEAAVLLGYPPRPAAMQGPAQEARADEGGGESSPMDEDP